MYFPIDGTNNNLLSNNALTVKNCGVNNSVIVGDLVDTEEDPCF